MSVVNCASKTKCQVSKNDILNVLLAVCDIVISK